MVSKDLEDFGVVIIKSGPQIIEKSNIFYLKSDGLGRRRSKSNVDGYSSRRSPSPSPRDNNDNKKKNEIDEKITNMIKKGKEFDDIYNELNIDKYLKRKSYK